jgi:outer membrane protein assembly factor BamB
MKLQCPRQQAFLCTAILSWALSLAGSAHGQSWSNLGGNGRMNGLSPVAGPDSASDLAWQGGAPSLIAWPVMSEGRRIFTVRQSAEATAPVSTDSTIHALDVETGVTLWTRDLPRDSGDWTAWIAGVKNGRVYASRSGNGGSVGAPLYCLDAATGATLWHTAGGNGLPRVLITGGPYSGAVFAEDGDLIMPSVRTLDRFDAQTGQRLWSASRTEQVGNSAGAVIVGNAIYVADAASGMQVAIRKFDATTGQFLHRGPLLTGGLLHNGPLVGIDGRIYLHLTRSESLDYDFLYSFTDTGTAIVQNWRASSGGGGAFSRWGVGPDGSIYTMSWTGTPHWNNQGRLQRLDPNTGAVLAESSLITGDSMLLQMVVDARGVLYVSNGTSGGMEQARLYSFNADLTERWSVPISGNSNLGGPSLCEDGTLLLASSGTELRAYRSTPRCPEDIDGTGDVDSGDVAFALLDYGPCPRCSSDLDGSGYVDFGDMALILLAFGPCN